MLDIKLKNNKSGGKIVVLRDMLNSMEYYAMVLTSLLGELMEDQMLQYC